MSLVYAALLCPPCVCEKGDSSDDLDYYDESSLMLPDLATITGENGVAANLQLPSLGYAAVYRLGTGASLGAYKGLIVDTSPPSVVQVECGVIECDAMGPRAKSH